MLAPVREHVYINEQIQRFFRFKGSVAGEFFVAFSPFLPVWAIGIHNRKYMTLC